MAAEEAIKAALASLVGGRYYFEQAPQDAVLPYIVGDRITAPRENTLNRSVTLVNPQFQIACFAADTTQARALAAQVKTAMKTAGVTNELTDDSIDFDPVTELDFVSLSYSCWETE